MNSLNDGSEDVPLPPDDKQWSPIVQRSPEAKLAYIQGVRAGIDLAAHLAAIYEGQENIKNKVKHAGNGMVDVMASTLAIGYPCSVCGYDNTCGEPPGEDCHS